MDYLELKGLDYNLYPLSTYSNQYGEEEYDKDGYQIYYPRYVESIIYINPEKNVSVMYEQERYDKNEFLDDCTDICELTNHNDFVRLIEYMNNHDNFTIYWSQDCGRTADFDIIQGEYIKDHNEIYDALDKIDGYKIFKYRIVTKIDDDTYHAEKF